MSQFNQVSIETKANIYFDGKVTSRTVLFPDGTKKTLGIMLPGEYEFGTGLKEVMEIQAGELKVLLPGASEWVEFNGTGEFIVPKQSKFKLVVHTPTDYICSYIPE